MKRKNYIKKYIYSRDEGKCHFCGKKLLFKQMSVDHYLPKSKGGPNDIFNLVLSCKKCNKIKKSYVPEDYTEVILALLKKAVQDEKITLGTVKIKKEDLNFLIQEVERIEDIGEFTVFQSKSYRFYIKHNKIYKVVYVDSSS
ncbi:MAG: hypothetical protein PWP27_1672 [Clostridiales bacterium]|nr:hypothetical protein [Clostridiales bacterium]MDK2933862.1 hypothetical protein [Clostridiales bacterium]